MNEIECGRYINMLNQWLIIKHEGKSLDTYLTSWGKKKIAVYGMGIYGRHLVRELQDSNVTILYGIDRKDLEPYKNIDIFHLSKKLPPVDVVINTVILEHTAIKRELSELLECPVISLEELVFESYE